MFILIYVKNSNMERDLQNSSWTPSDGDGNSTPSAWYGNSTPSAGDGNSTPSAGDGILTPSAGDGNSTPSAWYGNSTPSYENSTPSYENSTPSYENSTPSYENSTPSYENSTPSYENSTPSYRGPTPSHDSNSIHEDDASNFRYLLYKMLEDSESDSESEDDASGLLPIESLSESEDDDATSHEYEQLATEVIPDDGKIEPIRDDWLKSNLSNFKLNGFPKKLIERIKNLNSVSAGELSEMTFHTSLIKSEEHSYYFQKLVENLTILMKNRSDTGWCERKIKSRSRGYTDNTDVSSINVGYLGMLGHELDSGYFIMLAMKNNDTVFDSNNIELDIQLDTLIKNCVGFAFCGKKGEILEIKLICTNPYAILDTNGIGERKIVRSAAILFKAIENSSKNNNILYNILKPISSDVAELYKERYGFNQMMRSVKSDPKPLF